MRQDNLKLRLAYSTIGQLAYIVLAAALANSHALAAGTVHIAAHAFGKITLFFCAGAIYTATGRTKVSELSDDQLENYLSKIPDKILYAYNVYQIEGEGRKLFQSIKGDEDTIMGLPIKKIKEYISSL